MFHMVKPPLPHVRRGNAEDHQALRQAVIDAAMRLFQTQGLAGVTMRAVASEVGVSAMALYRYFPNKAGLLQGLWTFTLADLHDTLQARLDALAPSGSARARMRAVIDAFMGFFEARPDCYRLLFMTDQTLLETPETRWTAAPAYQQTLQLASEVTLAVARDIGGSAARVRMASDLRFALTTGYLHARLVNTRYPWQDLDALRQEAIEQIACAVERCLLGPPDQADPTEPAEPA